MAIKVKNMERNLEIKQPRFSISYMDTNVNPRQDFYRYANGGWLDKNSIPPDKTEWGTFNELFEWNMEVLHGIAEECASNIGSGGQVATLVGKFYLSATNEKLAEDLRFAPIEDLWNSISDAKSVEELIRLIPKLHLAGVMVLFDVYSGVDARNSSIYALHLDQGGLSLPNRDYYLLDSFAKEREEFREHMAKMFMLKGVDKETANNWANSVLEFETNLAKASRSPAELRDVEKNYNRIDASSFETQFHVLKVNDYLNGIGAGGIAYAIVGQPEFFGYLEKVLNDIDMEKLRPYFYWHVLTEYARFLHREVFEEDFDFFCRKLEGQQQPAPRWKRAIYEIDEQIGDALGKLYVERQFGSEAREKAMELVRNIINAFRRRLNEADWMSEETRKLAIEKLDAMRIKIGSTTKFKDYAGLEIKSDDFVGNVRRSYEFELRRQMARIGKPVDDTEWDMTPPTVNAYYSEKRNEIVFPAGILQPPFFDARMDDAVNYGSIGTVIGHEITHGFDDQGRHYDLNGNMKDWWVSEDIKKFNEKAEEVAKLYGSQEVLPGVFISGRLTLGENIADLGGLNIAFDALEEDLSMHPEKRKTIDGFTPEQRFFLAYAQLWKSLIREEELRIRITEDPHSPDKYRVIIPVTNHPAFDAAFPPSAPIEDTTKKRVGVW